MFRTRTNARAELLSLILAITIVFIVVGYNSSENNNLFAQSDQFSQSMNASKNQAILQFQTQFCGMNSTKHNNSFISEYSLPQKCEMPLGILADNDSIWYISTKLGLLGKLNINDNNSQEFKIPKSEAKRS